MGDLLVAEMRTRQSHRAVQQIVGRERRERVS
jgi:hypothetical protein